MIYKSLINNLKIIYNHDYLYISKLKGIQKFYDIEVDKNPLTKKITQRKTKRCKRCQQIK